MTTKKPKHMTVKQLREALAKYPDNMDVFMAERKTEFAYGLVNSVNCECIDFYEDGDEEQLGDAVAQVDVIILDEE
jgi:hypothetical protein